MGKIALFAGLVVLLVLIGVGVVVEPQFRYTFIPVNYPTHPGKQLEVTLTDGVLTIYWYPAYGQHMFSTPSPGSSLHFDTNAVPFPPSGLSWYGLPRFNHGGGSAGPQNRVGLPIGLPTLIMLGAVVIILIRTRRGPNQRGACAECGYSLDGIDSSVCPECGEGSDG